MKMGLACRHAFGEWPLPRPAYANGSFRLPGGGGQGMVVYRHLTFGGKRAHYAARRGQRSRWCRGGSQTLTFGVY
jgi:hypothetical protein